jgi:hypothetical protein
MNELRNRGVEDVLIAIVDGLKGFPEAITAVQTCIVHLIRHSFGFVSYKDPQSRGGGAEDHLAGQGCRSRSRRAGGLRTRALEQLPR